MNKAPDAEARFKAVSEAYEALSDEGKRAVYDRYGEAGLKAGFGPDGPPPGAAAAAAAGFSGFGGGAGGGFSASDAYSVFEQIFGSRGFKARAAAPGGAAGEYGGAAPGGFAGEYGGGFGGFEGYEAPEDGPARGEDIQ